MVKRKILKNTQFLHPVFYFYKPPFLFQNHFVASLTSVCIRVETFTSVILVSFICVKTWLYMRRLGSDAVSKQSKQLQNQFNFYLGTQVSNFLKIKMNIIVVIFKSY